MFSWSSSDSVPVNRVEREDDAGEDGRSNTASSAIWVLLWVELVRVEALRDLGVPMPTPRRGWVSVSSAKMTNPGS